MTYEVEKESSFPILSDEDRTGFGRGPHKWLSVQPKVRGMDPAALDVVFEANTPFGG
jgi:hypothetical protein